MFKEKVLGLMEAECSKLLKNYPVLTNNNVMDFAMASLNGDYFRVRFRLEDSTKMSVHWEEAETYFREISNGFFQMSFPVIEMGINKSDKLERLLEGKYIQTGTLELIK